MKTNLEKLNSLYDSCKIILEESDPCKLKSEGCFCANRQDKDKTLLSKVKTNGKKKVGVK